MRKNTHQILQKPQWQRWAWGVAGGVFFTLAMIGMVLPVLPTTPFLLLTAGCWAKGSPKFHQWLINHRLFGKLIRDWQANGSIPLLAKIVAISMMAISCTLLFLTLPDHRLWLAWVSLAFCAVVAGWMISRPNR